MSKTKKETKGETLFKTPLILRSDQIVFESPEIELSVFRNDETSRNENIEIKIQVNLSGTTVTGILSRHESKETEKVETEYKNIIQGLTSGQKKIIISGESGGFFFKIAKK